MRLSVMREHHPGELRVALTPTNVSNLASMGCDIFVETGAGDAAGFPDASYRDAGAEILDTRKQLLEQGEVILCVEAAQPDALDDLRSGHICIGMMDPLSHPERFPALAARGITSLALELVPRISRAQSMDALSSIATLAGYKAVLLAAAQAPRIFPMMMTAAGTLNPSRVFIMGAGVAGLQAAATAKRLGAVVEAYDVRPTAREQILSVGARPIELDLDTSGSEGQGGYASEQGDDFLERQREQMTAVLAQQDVVITTAAIPGAKAPVLITEAMVQGMKHGAVIVDLAAERGGNCELSRPGETVTAHGVTIIGPANIAATLPHHASQMYGRNMENLLRHLLDDEGRLSLDFEDEILDETVITHAGTVRATRIRERLPEAPLPAQAEEIA
ncbi:Re/Si-specific NAD(P)(+) transhydrogenase subunit alpha [uncultured Halomonas sp.]|uniref:Re/Si-specific NAD(P)(+) transhydrogenase subunit alpha n=1 Tax=uncultured Halomonas sp. TaxID=173971 RepID=UPI0026363775|nr:Re/Si-specific NAD(P)(+) transhydrogenase subunit alpha [uncultured Halomonas sp.]